MRFTVTVTVNAMARVRVRVRVRARVRVRVRVRFRVRVRVTVRVRFRVNVRVGVRVRVRRNILLEECHFQLQRIDGEPAQGNFIHSNRSDQSCRVEGAEVRWLGHFPVSKHRLTAQSHL